MQAKAKWVRLLGIKYHCDDITSPSNLMSGSKSVQVLSQTACLSIDVPPLLVIVPARHLTISASIIWLPACLAISQCYLKYFNIVAAAAAVVMVVSPVASTVGLKDTSINVGTDRLMIDFVVLMSSFVLVSSSHSPLFAHVFLLPMFLSGLFTLMFVRKCCKEDGRRYALPSHTHHFYNLQPHGEDIGRGKVFF